MSRPSRSTVRVGLPSNPRSRSVAASDRRGAGVDLDYPPRPSSAAGSRPYTPSSPPALPRSLRAQRSMADLPSAYTYTEDRGRMRPGPGRQAPPPVPPLPSGWGRDRNDTAWTHSPRQGSASSIDTSVSGGSALSLQSGGYASSATSVDEDDAKTQKPEPGFGSSLWGRVAAAAGTLTVNVSKAWETNVAVYSGEITPPGQESRLTRALKAYHIAKAQSPADLPDWLFDERERGVSRYGRSDRARSDIDGDMDSGANTNIDAPRGKPFSVKDIVLPPAPTPSQRPSAPRRTYAPDEEVAPMSRAAQRLKEMAEARRAPTRKKSIIQFVEPDHPRRRGEPAAPAVPAMPIASKQNEGRWAPQAQAAGSRMRGLPAGVRPSRG